ncbi:uncharacterized protein LOC124209126 isoform X1 [Daphnia pulex]|uniref:uncharacterized protein LOC124209126 isoform X1 n=2 Tax=Daphnia pulex TaxID=6669 RepID=UPI001EE1313D|nr:uncharacterized protein LOC124209126 isoform X1 [Daphnia pulex]
MNTSILVLVFVAVVVAVMAAPPAKYDGYFQYANVPGDSEYEFGFNRGNPSHYTSRYEQSKDSRFRTKVKWADNNEGYGEQYWEYNHSNNYAPAPVYPAPVYPAPAYPAPTYPVPSYEGGAGAAA